MRFAPSLSGSSPMFQASWVNDSLVLCCPPSVCCACLSFSGGAPARADVGNEVSEINSRTAEIFSKHFCWLCFLTLFAAAWWWRAFVAVVRVHLVCVSRAVPRFECSYLTFYFFKKKFVLVHSKCSFLILVIFQTPAANRSWTWKDRKAMSSFEVCCSFTFTCFLCCDCFFVLQRRMLFSISLPTAFWWKYFFHVSCESFGCSLGNGDVIKSHNAHFL